MQKEQIFSAANVDRAIEKAIQELHMDRDALSVEVLDIGRKGFFGFGASDAKIRVSYQIPDEPKAKPEQAAEKSAVNRQQTQPEKPAEKQELPKAPETPKAQEAPKTQETPRQKDGAPRLVKAAPQSDKPAAAPVKQKAKTEEQPRLVRAASGNAPKKEARPAENEHPRERRSHNERTGRVERTEHPEAQHTYEKPVPLAESEWSAQAKTAVDFISGLLEKMGIEGRVFVNAKSDPEHLRLEIEGADMGAVIGRRGDTLDAIQYLTSLVMNQGAEEHLRLTIDTENYRGKRAESLERLAHKMAGKVARYHKPMTLEPMNPYERRIIHAALQEYRGVSTHSTGTEPNRRVVISPEGGRRSSDRKPRE